MLPRIVLIGALGVLLAHYMRGASMEPKYRSAEEAELKGVVRTNLDSPNPTEAQLERKRRSIQLVSKMGLPVIEHLPVVEDEAQLAPRAPRDVAERCIAVVICAIKGEAQGKDQPLIDKLVSQFGAANYFSPAERNYIRAQQPTRQDLIDYCWRYECAHVFLWALGHLESLKPPNEICDVSREVSILRDVGAEAFVAATKLRSYSEILDQADLYYRLHWAAIELRLKGKKSPDVDEGIIRERHRALNWLIRYMGQEWDDVTTDT